MNVIDRSAIDALHRMEEQRKAREDRMRNALMILADARVSDHGTGRGLGQFVRATAREGLGRDEPTNQGGSIMGWKWDAAKAHDVQITVTPASTEESTVGIVWGDKPAETKTVKNDDAEKLLHQLAQQIQQLGYMM